MIVVGGIYQETVVNPESSELVGSGLRAAAALADGGITVELYSAAHASQIEEIGMIAGALKVNVAQLVDRDEIIEFRYSTPISSPSINGVNARIKTTQEHVAQADTALVFGMIEAPNGAYSIDAPHVIYDPQKPRDTELLGLPFTNAKRKTLVANGQEIRRLGKHSNPRVAATNLIDRGVVDEVVTKRGAVGCMVTTYIQDIVHHELLGAHPTSRVWPIGSGDAFSAGFAHASEAGADAVEAARVGSMSAAYWCSTRSYSIPSTLLGGDADSLSRPLPPAAGMVYLAGPFFSVAERWLVETVRDELYSLGVKVWSPVHEVGPGGLEVAKADIEGLEQCDAVIALLDHADPGTVFEVGWAVRSSIPVIGFGNSIDAEGMKMMAGTTVELHSDLSTACYRAAWAAMGMRPIPGVMS